MIFSHKVQFHAHKIRTSVERLLLSHSLNDTMLSVCGGNGISVSTTRSNSSTSAKDKHLAKAITNTSCYGIIMNKLARTEEQTRSRGASIIFIPVRVQFQYLSYIYRNSAFLLSLSLHITIDMCVCECMCLRSSISIICFCFCFARIENCLLSSLCWALAWTR